MPLFAKDVVWNRASLEGGGRSARVGDRALADALKAHGLVMNGGVHHAVQDALSVTEVQAAIAGFEYLGLSAIGEVLRRVQHDPKLRVWSDATENEANELYWAVLPDDSKLIACFESLFQSKLNDFEPVDDATQAV